jgi:cytochrome b6-f complex iron-sulfur subunit
MKRRDFLAWVGVGSVASSLPVAIATFVSPSQAQTFVDLGAATALDNGGSINMKVDGKPIIAILNPADNTTVVARTATCSHAGCTVNWKADQKEFVCPCHGSRFAVDGAVLPGSLATQPLQPLPAEIENGRVMVSV